MASQVVVSGRIRHKHMDAAVLMERVRKHFPNLEKSEYDFVVPLGDCRARFLCVSATNLDFEIMPDTSNGVGRTSSPKAVTAVEMLVRSTDTVWEGLSSALKARRVARRPGLDRCVIEDTQSKTALLIRESRSPLHSVGAKVAYLISATFVVLCLGLVVWQISAKQSPDARTANILSIAMALGVAAITTPIPVFVDWYKWKKSLAWRYVRAG